MRPALPCPAAARPPSTSSREHVSGGSLTFSSWGRRGRDRETERPLAPWDPEPSVQRPARGPRAEQVRVGAPLRPVTWRVTTGLSAGTTPHPTVRGLWGIPPSQLGPAWNSRWGWQGAVPGRGPRPGRLGHDRPLRARALPSDTGVPRAHGVHSGPSPPPLTLHPWPSARDRSHPAPEASGGTGRHSCLLG